MSGDVHTPPGPGLEPAPGAKVGRFYLLSPLGSGAMAVVWAAYDPQLDRRVALKLLRPTPSSATDDEDRARLLREAQAMARLTHPHVLAVHEVGVEGAAVYIAQELVEGVDLARWLRDAPGGRRPRAQVLDLFTQAGRGLAAAHRAGLVHRDFKPANVLLGDDGRVRVADFGLARATDTSALPSTPPEALLDPHESPHDDALAETLLRSPGAAPPSSHGSLDSPMTQAGTILGTPGYMAPEQYRGEAADARTDQFAFCASLYQALYGELPFAGLSMGELSRAAQADQVKPAPRGTDVPPWLRAVVVRGLRARREERFPTLDALLAALGDDPTVARRRRWRALGATLLAAGVVAGLVAFVQHRTAVCRGAGQRLTGLWDAPRQQAMQAAFLATGAPWAPHAWESTRASLEAWTQAWVGMHTEACEATRLHGAQSEEVLDLRMECLAQGLAELKATTDLFVSADGQVVERAAEAAGRLAPVSTCADVAHLKAPTRLPRDLALRARVESVRAELARAKALVAAGKYLDAVTVAGAALERARPLGYRPLEAEALVQLGQARVQASQNEPGVQALEAGFHAALAGGRDDLAVEAAAALVRTIGCTQGHHDEGHRWDRLGQALLEHTGADEALGAQVANALAALRWSEGDYPGSAAEYRRAVALEERAAGPAHGELAGMLNDLAFTLYNEGQFDEAQAAYQRALVIDEAVLGLEHPLTAVTLNGLAVVLVDRGELARAGDAYARALAINEKALGPDHRNVGVELLNLADVLLQEGRVPEAVAHIRRAQGILSKALGPRHPDVASTHSYLADALGELGAPTEALAEARQAVAIDEEALGGEHPRLAFALSSLGLALLGAGQPQEAVTVLARAVGIRERAQGADHPEAAAARVRLGRAWLEAGDAAKALAELQSARPMVEEKLHEPEAPRGAALPIGAGAVDPASPSLRGHGDGAHRAGGPGDRARPRQTSGRDSRLARGALRVERRTGRTIRSVRAESRTSPPSHEEGQARSAGRRRSFSAARARAARRRG